jgi:hypothetical protein
MTNNMNNHIDRFVDYFNKQISEIGAINTQHAELYQRLLYASVLDTLAGTVFSKRTNRDRFVSFLQRFCKWPEGDKVSLSHLVQLLRKNPDPAFEKLRIWSTAKFKLLPVHGGQLMSISHDPSYEEVSVNWPSQKEHRTPLEGIDLTSLQHFQLLYAYRNTLIHEMRIPGYGMEFGSDENPFYHGMTTINDAGDITNKTIELVYPRKFLHRLCETGLEQLRLYLVENNLNPYDSRTFGTYWLSELNR